MTSDQPSEWRNRITGYGQEAPDQLLANPYQWKIHPKAQQDMLIDLLNRVGWVQNIVVNQRTGRLVDGHARVGLEPCFFGWVRPNKPKNVAGDHPRTVWFLPTIKPGVKTLHPTSKPLEVFALPMAQHTEPGDICYEPFAGSGSQFVAGEQMGRLVYGCEIAPEYVSVVLQRLADMGLTPRLIES